MILRMREEKEQKETGVNREEIEVVYKDEFDKQMRNFQKQMERKKE